MLMICILFYRFRLVSKIVKICGMWGFIEKIVCVVLDFIEVKYKYIV